MFGVRENYCHVHIGAGLFGLGMVLDICQKAGLSSIVLNRNSTKPHHERLRNAKGYRIVYDAIPEKHKDINLPFRYYQDHTDDEAIQLVASPEVNLLTTSVKPDGLRNVAPLIARGIERRRQTDSGILCIFACENLTLNSEKLRDCVAVHLADETRRGFFERAVVFCNTIVDRVCARIDLSCDPMEVHAEEYFEWLIESPTFLTPAIERLSRLDRVKLVRSRAEFEVYEKRKYWCLNAVQLVGAAYTYRMLDRSVALLSKGLEDADILEKVIALQNEMGFALRLFAHNRGVLESFSEEAIQAYNTQVLQRLRANKFDRVARLLKQKEIAAIKEEVAKLNALPTLELLPSVLRAKLKTAIELLDLHEFLDKVAERILEPQELIVSHYEDSRVNCPHLQLDDALQSIVIALQNYSKACFDATRS
jgi:mannitol-1-phosphate/altronate dehydrogenase